MATVCEKDVVELFCFVIDQCSGCAHYAMGMTTQNWGGLTRAIIYHQVRKHLLIMSRREESTSVTDKHWRPSFLVITRPNEIRFDATPSVDAMVRLANLTKKGGILVIGQGTVM